MDRACWSELELLGGSYDDTELTLYPMYLAPRAELVESSGALTDAVLALHQVFAPLPLPSRPAACSSLRLPASAKSASTA